MDNEGWEDRNTEVVTVNPQAVYVQRAECMDVKKKQNKKSVNVRM